MWNKHLLLQSMSKSAPSTTVTCRILPWLLTPHFQSITVLLVTTTILLLLFLMALQFMLLGVLQVVLLATNVISTPFCDWSLLRLQHHTKTWWTRFGATKTKKWNVLLGNGSTNKNYRERKDQVQSFVLYNNLLIHNLQLLQTKQYKSCDGTRNSISDGSSWAIPRVGDSAACQHALPHQRHHWSSPCKLGAQQMEDEAPCTNEVEAPS